jgi:hypothetical protein
LKHHHPFHPILEFGIVVNQLNDEDFGLDNFEMIIETNELAKELVYKELQMFWRYQIDGKGIKYLLER